MGFILGLIVSALLITCLFCEMAGIFRFLFSIIFLVGILGFIFLLFTAGVLLTPLFLGGFLVNIVFFFILGPYLMNDTKEKK